MSDGSNREPLRPSAFYAESVVRCALPDAWRMMLDYKAWNPAFVYSETRLVRGEPGREGELTFITLLDERRTSVAEYYAETMKVVAPHHIVWYVFPKEDEEDSFRSFVHFALDKAQAGLKFQIHYHAQNRVSEPALAQLRTDMDTKLRNLVMAFKSYCESRS